MFTRLLSKIGLLAHLQRAVPGRGRRARSLLS